MTSAQRCQLLAETPGLVAFWNFIQDGEDGWSAVTAGGKTAYPLRLHRIGDARAYGLADWPYRDQPSQPRFAYDGPFGRALHCNLGYIFAAVAREDFAGTALDIGPRQACTLVAWIKFTGRRHLIAGIWDEGGWDPYAGERQVALFGGLFKQAGLIAHVSATGAASHPQAAVPGSQYARRRAIDPQVIADDQWVCVAMTVDPDRQRVCALLDGVMQAHDLADLVVDATRPASPVMASNPYAYRLPLYHPRAFSMIFNGYDGASGVSEHRLFIDLDRAAWQYATLAGAGGVRGVAPQSAQLRVRFLDAADAVLADVTVQAHGGAGGGHLPAELREAARVEAALALAAEDGWEQVGEPVSRPVLPGAPFTFGRALGLGSDSLDHGSQLFIDGVAVFDRVLSEAELRERSFTQLS